MAAKRQLGAILLESGRINQTDVDRVLEYQRTHGGFFGQAIVALGILSREEIDWALASQFDLPFIFPNPEAVDREAAMLVPADWALAHLAVPIFKAGRSLTVVVADPLDNETLEDLAVRTGFEVEMALASASRIRELIRTIYGDAVAVKADATPVTLTDLMTQALESGADRICISSRGAHATAWYSTRHGREKRPLLEGWDTILEDMLDPSPFEIAAKSRGTVQMFEANLNRGTTDITIDVHVLNGGSGTEFLLQPRRSRDARRVATATLPPAVAAELRMLARSGNARVGVPASEDGFARDVVPQVPSLVFGDDVRTAHVTTDQELPGIYTLNAGSSGNDFIAALEAYEFDAVTVDLPAGDDRVRSILGTSPISFVYVPSADDRDALANAGINWLLSVSRDQDALVWELRAVNR